MASHLRFRWFMRLIRVLLHPRTAWIILAVSLVLTALAWHLSSSYLLKRGQERFDFRADEVHKLIGARLVNYEQVLRGGSALFEATGEPSRVQWQHYVATLQMERYFPGIQGVGYSKVIAPDAREAHVAAVRSEGYPDYRMRPDGERDIYTSIIYLEPFVARNLRAFGFDMYSEATRRAAMSRARDEGKPAMSAMVTLVQEDGKDVQKGLLMYAPVYRRGMPLASVAERRVALTGWVYSPFRIKDLMQGILGNNMDDIDFAIYDDAQMSKLLYTSAASGEARTGTADKPDFTRMHTLTNGGHAWTVVYRGRGFLAGDELWLSSGVAIGGLLIDLLLFITIATIAAQKREIEQEVVTRTQDLRERSADIATLFELSPDGLVILRRPQTAVGQRSRIEYVNPAFEKLTGLAAADLLGKSQTELEAMLATRLHLEAGGMSAGGNRLCLRTPEYRVLSRGMRENDANRFIYYRDITQEVEVERMKSEFLTTAAHELRTPMVSIFGFTELMLTRPYDARKQRDMLDTIHRQTRLLINMLNELLDLARIEARQGKDFKISPQPLAALIQDVVSAASPGDARPLHVAAAGAYFVNVDPEKTRQALLNVLSNAFKYSSPEQPITVTVIGDGVSADHIGIRVSDAGIGMSPSQLARACERFFRADASGNIPGNGLGLALVKEIVELQGGRIELQSELGKGTSVTLWLPLADSAPQARAA